MGRRGWRSMQGLNNPEAAPVDLDQEALAKKVLELERELAELRGRIEGSKP